ncbi:MAG TPA: alpha/beta hydrolase [Mycobacteriales bacterium]|nr:alpha/beta hydrolase [Mycobacteriales bacterium]
MTRFSVISSDGTSVAGWRNNGDGPPVLICNGLGTPPAAWPRVIAADRGFRVASWYYRGTGGGERPADAEHITIDDHVQDALAVMNHEGIDKALLACWSLGVNIGFELARQHPERVAGILAVAGVPGGTFQSIGGRLKVPKPLRYGLGVSGARAMRRLGPSLSWTAQHLPLNRFTATVINHSGMVLPAAKPEWLIPALEEFREHDFRWYFTLALAGAKHKPMDLAFVSVPVTLVAGEHDVITSTKDMVEAAGRIPHAELRVLPGSHFLPLEYPEELADELDALAGRTDLPQSA